MHSKCWVSLCCLYCRLIKCITEAWAQHDHQANASGPTRTEFRFCVGLGPWIWTVSYTLPYTNALKQNKSLTVEFWEVLLLNGFNTNKPDRCPFHCKSLCCQEKGEMTGQQKTDRWERGRQPQVTAGRGGAGPAGSDRCEAGFREAGTGQEGAEREQRRERGDPRLGASCSVLPRSNRGARSERATLPLPIPITLALLLCFHAWFMLYLLTLHFLRMTKELVEGDRRLTPMFYFRGTL